VTGARNAASFTVASAAGTASGRPAEREHSATYRSATAICSGDSAEAAAAAARNKSRARASSAAREFGSGAVLASRSARCPARSAIV